MRNRVLFLATLLGSWDTLASNTHDLSHTLKKPLMTYLKRFSFAALFAALTLVFAMPDSAQAQAAEAGQAQQQQAAQVTPEKLLAAAQDIDAELQKAEQLGEVSSANVVSASSVLDGKQLDTFNKAVKDADKAALRSFVSGQSALSDALSANQVASEDVVALVVPSKGKVVLVTK